MRLNLEVLEGRVWLTQAGCREDVILGRGARYSMEGEGALLMGLDGRALVDLSRAQPSRWRWLRSLARTWKEAAEARAAARELEQLPDYRLRDLGICRDQIKLRV